MKTRRVALFVDYPNVISTAIHDNHFVNFHHLIEKASNHGNLVIARAYLSSSTTITKGMIALQRAGFDVKIRPVPDTPWGKKDIDTYMASDILEVAYERNVDLIAIASDDSDFVPIVRNVRAQGIKCIALVSDFRKASFLVSSADDADIIDYVKFNPRRLITSEKKIDVEIRKVDYDDTS